MLVTGRPVVILDDSLLSRVLGGGVVHHHHTRDLQIRPSVQRPAWELAVSKVNHHPQITEINQTVMKYGKEEYTVPTVDTPLTSGSDMQVVLYNNENSGPTGDLKSRYQLQPTFEDYFYDAPQIQYSVLNGELEREYTEPLEFPGTDLREITESEFKGDSLVPEETSIIPESPPTETWAPSHPFPTNSNTSLSAESQADISPESIEEIPSTDTCSPKEIQQMDAPQLVPDEMELNFEKHGAQPSVEESIKRDPPTNESFSNNACASQHYFGEKILKAWTQGIVAVSKCSTEQQKIDDSCPTENQVPEVDDLEPAKLGEDRENPKGFLSLPLRPSRAVIACEEREEQLLVESDSELEMPEIEEATTASEVLSSVPPPPPIFLLKPITKATPLTTDSSSIFQPPSISLTDSSLFSLSFKLLSPKKVTQSLRGCLAANSEPESQTAAHMGQASSQLQQPPCKKQRLSTDLPEKSTTTIEHKAEVPSIDVMDPQLPNEIPATMEVHCTPNSELDISQQLNTARNTTDVPSIPNSEPDISQQFNTARNTTEEPSIPNSELDISQQFNTARNTTEVPSSELDRDTTEVPSSELDRDTTEVPSIPNCELDWDTTEVPSIPNSELDRDTTEVPGIPNSESDRDTTEVPGIPNCELDRDTTEVPSIPNSELDRDTTEVPSIPNSELDRDSTEVPGIPNCELDISQQFNTASGSTDVPSIPNSEPDISQQFNASVEEEATVPDLQPVAGSVEYPHQPYENADDGLDTAYQAVPTESAREHALVRNLVSCEDRSGGFGDHGDSNDGSRDALEVDPESQRLPSQGENKYQTVLLADSEVPCLEQEEQHFMERDSPSPELPKFSIGTPLHTIVPGIETTPMQQIVPGGSLNNSFATPSLYEEENKEVKRVKFVHSPNLEDMDIDKLDGPTVLAMALESIDARRKTLASPEYTEVPDKSPVKSQWSSFYANGSRFGSHYGVTPSRCTPQSQGTA